MTVAVAVALAGGVGAVARYLLDGAIQDRTAGAFPFGTFTVNVVGSFILGAVAAVVLRHGVSTRVEAVLGAGFCGGLTTWSTAAWEVVRLVEEASWRVAAAYAAANLGASLGAAGLALALFWH